MRKLILISFLSIFAMLLTCGSAQAHHGSRAYYDMSKAISMTGTVTNFAWQNPHVYVLFDVTDTQGHVEHWAAETYSITVLERNNGWTRHTLKPGETITITLWKAKNGSPRGYISKVAAGGQSYVITTH